MSAVKDLERVRARRVGELSSFEPVGRDQLRDTLGRFATGVTVVSAGRQDPSGMTANSFTSVSLDPPLILVCVNRRAAVHEAILSTRSFGVSVLSSHQENVARHFSGHALPGGEREFDVVDWSPAPNTGVPVIDGSVAWLECTLTADYSGGDHSIFLGYVLASGRGPARDALLFFGGGFHSPQLAR